MNEEKRPVLVLDLQLAGCTRRVFVTRYEFAFEVRKIEQRLGLIQRLLALRGGLTNRERKALDKEKRRLTRWLRNEPYGGILDNPSWPSEVELSIAKVWSVARHSKARKKKERWLARKHPSWLSDAELRDIRGEER